MGKHKKKKRESSYSSSKRSHSRSRSRNKRKSSEDSVRISSSHRLNLQSNKHFTYLCNQSKSIGVPYVVWNLCSKLVPRPRSTLVICQNMSQVAAVCQARNLNRTFKPIDESQREVDLKKIVEKEQIEVIIMSQKKCSILQALDDYQKVFDLIICTTKTVDIQFYLKINEMLNPESILVTFSDTIQSVKKLSQSLGVQIEQISAQLTESERNRQLKSDIQYARKPSSETYAFLNSFPFSAEQIAARFIQLDRIRREPPKSLHLGMPGYVTYKLDMDVEFNSLKYVWNFLREEFPKILYESLKGMQKYSNDKGVVFNIPCEMKYLIEIVVQKLKRNRLKLKGIELQQCAVLPLLQDADSQQSRLLREKKQLALQNKSELEIFIGGVPYEMDQNSLRFFFKDHEVNLFLVRILKDEKGFSKGIGFGLCQNKDHFERAIRLNGSKLIDRTIRVKRADQRKD